MGCDIVSCLRCIATCMTERIQKKLKEKHELEASLKILLAKSRCIYTSNVLIYCLMPWWITHRWALLPFNILWISITYRHSRLKDKKTKQETTWTQRISKEAMVEEIRQNIDNVRNIYLVHCYQIENEKYLWPKVLEKAKYEEKVFWMDYSENISGTLKWEQQDSHFSKQQLVYIAWLLISLPSVRWHHSWLLTSHLQ